MANEILLLQLPKLLPALDKDAMVEAQTRQAPRFIRGHRKTEETNECSADGKPTRLGRSGSRVNHAKSLCPSNSPRLPRQRAPVANASSAGAGDVTHFLTSPSKGALTSNPLPPCDPRASLPYTPSSVWDLPSGRVGRLKIRKSGRVTLVLCGAQADAKIEGASASHAGTLPEISRPGVTPQRRGVAVPKISGSHVEKEVEPRHACEGAGATDRKKGIYFDVNLGTPCHFKQEAAAFLKENKELIFLGECRRRLVISPTV
eukprot:GHVT01082431.1.p1 GENE.GHVT01082431.1~~GHVT01082431.1.p1  ORF type:complete len:260 (+),score=41.51 GHVT01082431.1:205-984(+)